MAVAFVQKSTYATSSADSFSTSFSVAASSGNFIGAVCLVTTYTRDFSFTDDGSNSYTKLTKVTGGDGTIQISYAYNVSAATNITSTVDANGGKERTIIAYEFSGVKTASDPLDVEGTFVRATNDTSHFSAAVGEIDTAADVAVIQGGSLNASGDTITESGSLSLGFKENHQLSQYTTSASALTDQRGSWTSSTSRDCGGAIASFVGAGGATRRIFVVS